MLERQPGCCGLVIVVSLLDRDRPLVVHPVGVAVGAAVAELVGENVFALVKYGCGDHRLVHAELRHRGHFG